MRVLSTIEIVLSVLQVLLMQAVNLGKNRQATYDRKCSGARERNLQDLTYLIRVCCR